MSEIDRRRVAANRRAAGGSDVPYVREVLKDWYEKGAPTPLELREQLPDLIDKLCRKPAARQAPKRRETTLAKIERVKELAEENPHWPYERLAADVDLSIGRVSEIVNGLWD